MSEPGAGVGTEAEVETEVDRATRARAVFRTTAAPRPKRGLVTLALLMAMTVTSLEQTVVSTAMPSIIATLRGLQIYPWVFSAYLLASTVTTPLYGKLADMFGRKRILLFGLGTFALGSVLSGLAQSMPQLIAMRVIQGVGAGAVAPIVITMLGDLFTLEERARVQGLFSVVWGVSSLAGPFLGGVLTDHLSWRWVFYVTVPFAAVAAWILLTHVREPAVRREVRPIDWGGAGLLSAGSIVLLAAVLRGGNQSPAVGLALVAAGVALLALFVRNERRAADPILPIDLLLAPNVLASVVGGFVIGALLFGIDTYIPLYVQGVQGGTATVAGRTITPLFLSWSISVVVAAWVVRPLGYRGTALAGSLLITVGAAALGLGATRPDLARLVFPLGLVVIGLGMGPTSLSYILDVQNSVARDRRGTATSAVMFSRMMGGALGVGLLGAVLGLELAHRLADRPGVDVAAALRPETHGQLPPALLQVVQDALGRSLGDVFWQMTGIAALGVVCSLGLRGGRAESHADAGRHHGHDPSEDVGLAALEV
jgi:MFS family permease